jgi:hypothetical protein
MRMANVIPVGTYLEAAGVILALRSGISLESVRRPLRALPGFEAAAVDAAASRAEAEDAEAAAAVP